MDSRQDNIIGIHAVTECLRQNGSEISQLLLQSGRRDKALLSIRELAQQQGIAIEEASKREMDKRFDGVHQGVVALISVTSKVASEKDLIVILDKLDHPPLLLVLDGVTDPHNLGACLRTADAVGVDAVIVPKDKSAPLNATVRKVACGAAETVAFISVTNLARCLQTLKERGIWLVGTADETAKSLFQQDLTGPLALIMGSEGTGLRRLTRENCDFLVAIPMAGALSSLNVSVATGVCLFEAARQRTK